MSYQRNTDIMGVLGASSWSPAGIQQLVNPPLVGGAASGGSTGGLSTSTLVVVGALGVGAFLLWRKFHKKASTP